MEKNKRGRGVERGERFRRIDFSSPPSAENQSTFSGSGRCLLIRPLVSAPPDGVHTVACRPNGRCLRVAYPGYIIRQRQSPAIQLGCPSLVLVHDSIDDVSPGSCLQNKSLRRSNPATGSQGSRWHAARQAVTAWNPFDATKGQVPADREIF